MSSTTGYAQNATGHVACSQCRWDQLIVSLTALHACQWGRVSNLLIILTVIDGVCCGDYWAILHRGKIVAIIACSTLISVKAGQTICYTGHAGQCASVIIVSSVHTYKTASAIRTCLALRHAVITFEIILIETIIASLAFGGRGALLAVWIAVYADSSIIVEPIIV